MSDEPYFEIGGHRIDPKDSQTIYKGSMQGAIDMSNGIMSQEAVDGMNRAKSDD